MNGYTWKLPMHMAMQNRIEQHFRESAELHLHAMETLAAPIATAIDILFLTLTNNGKVLVCGNGGSAADAQHFAAELIGRFEQERPSLAALALTTDTSILTAVANDYDFTEVFARQIRGLGQAGDVLIALSTSGYSANVLAAIEAAHERDMRVIALTGKGGGAVLQALNAHDLSLCVPAERTSRIQEIHLLTLHCLCDGIDAMLLGD